MIIKKMLFAFNTILARPKLIQKRFCDMATGLDTKPKKATGLINNNPLYSYNRLELSFGL